MKQSLLQEKYPIYCLEIDQAETSHRDIDSVVAYLRGCIEDHHSACFIADFDTMRTPGPCLRVRSAKTSWPHATLSSASASPCRTPMSWRYARAPSA